MWHDKQPIYQQLKDRMTTLIMNGTLVEGAAMPSVRQLAMDYHINPLTITKAYQLLVEEDLIGKQRGLGMFVKIGARQRAFRQEQRRFLQEEWPLVHKKIEQLGLNITDLLNTKRTEP